MEPAQGNFWFDLTQPRKVYLTYTRAQLQSLVLVACVKRDFLGLSPADVN